MSFLKKLAACFALAATIGLATPHPAQADGAASTRNLIILGAGIVYTIIQHNQQVHNQHAYQVARRQAALCRQYGGNTCYNNGNGGYSNGVYCTYDQNDQQVCYQRRDRNQSNRDDEQDQQGENNDDGSD